MAVPTDSEARAEEIDRAEKRDEEKADEAKAEAPRDKPKKRSGKGRGKGDKASEGRAAYLAGHAVIWLGVLGSVAYLMARGR